MLELASVLQQALPVVYTLGSAIAIVYRARTTAATGGAKPIQSSYQQIAEYDLPIENDEQPLSPEELQRQATDHYRKERSSNLPFSLARLALTGTEWATTTYALWIFTRQDTESDLASLASCLIQVATWTYAFTLTTVDLAKPKLAHRLNIRILLDLYYVLRFFTSIAVMLGAWDLFGTPVANWDIFYQIELVSLAQTVLLILIGLSSRQFQDYHPPKIVTPEAALRAPSIEYGSTVFSQLTFSWVNPLVYLGYSRTLEDVDLGELEYENYSSHSLARYLPNKQDSLFWSLFAVLKWEFFAQFLWAMPWCVLINVAPWCLNKIIAYIEDPGDQPVGPIYFYVFTLFFSSILESLCNQQALHIGRRIFVHTTSICNAEVFNKSLRRKDISSSAQADEKTPKADGKSNPSLNIANLIAVDVKKLEIPFSYVFYLYGFPVQFLLAGVQLYWLLGYASLVGVACMILTYPIPAKLYSMIMRLFKDIMNTKDERMDALNEMLSAIRIVKFFGWESKFEEKITAAREKELQKTKESYVQMIATDIVWMIVPLFNIVVILTAYVKVFGHELVASKIFTTLALFNIMRESLNTLPWQIKNTMQAAVSVKRINKFLLEEELVRDTVITKISANGKDLAIATAAGTPVIGFTNASFKWPNSENEKKPEAQAETPKVPLMQRIKNVFSRKSEPVAVAPVAKVEEVQERFRLQNINVEFPVGKLSVIVGPTGCGKSALLLALLGELERQSGDVYLPRTDYGAHKGGDGSGVAYVAQTAWLQNSTIRENILFGREFDQERYDAVLEGCALVTDMEILESGDATEIGEQGITLSGGQKQRVSLARAIYSNAHTLLLDDCLSAVDSHTGKHLFSTLTGPLVQGRTVLLVTHQVQLTMNAAELVVVMNKGEIVGSGSADEAIKKGWVEHVALESDEDTETSETGTLNGGDSKPKAAGVAAEKQKVSVKLTEDEKKQEGSVALKVYLTYLQASGGWFFWIGVVILFISREAIKVSQNAWLAVWANQVPRDLGLFTIRAVNYITPAPISEALYKSFQPVAHSPVSGISAMFAEPIDNNYYLGIFILLSIMTLLWSSLTEYYTIFGGLAASRVLHQKLLHKITRAKIRFFDTTPMGRIVNRFSSDISTIDDEVSQGIQGILGSFLNVAGIVVVISLNMPLFMVPACLIVVIYAVIGALYVPISRDLKRLNSNSRSPILNHFNEALTGLVTIRAYGFEKRFLSKNLVNLDNNNRTFYLLWSTNRWLHWRVDIAGALVAFVTGFLILRNYDTIAPGWAAFSLSYSLLFTGSIVWLIRIYAQNEMNLNSVERVAEYMELEEEPPAIIEGSRPPASWPHSGQIEVENLTMKYAPDAPAVIKDISFKINGGEKIGVVGRTGSGKSTLAISLFRFMDPVSGTIKIDGIDICKIGLQDLRSNLTIIPQDPVLFKGTLRSNLDPFGELEDVDLWQALRQSHLVPESTPGASASASKTPSLLNGVANQATKVPTMTSSSSAETPLLADASATTADAPTSGSGSSSVKDEVVDASKLTLDTPIKENGNNLSQGQRQLVALSRALCRRSKLIVMDEATASIDVVTDSLIQRTIRSELGDTTILCIAHRLRTIADFDRVIVMNAGEIEEFDTPLSLMQKEGGLFRSMCERSQEFDDLLAIATEKERKGAAGEQF